MRLHILYLYFFKSHVPILARGDFFQGQSLTLWPGRRKVWNEVTESSERRHEGPTDITSQSLLGPYILKEWYSFYHRVWETHLMVLKHSTFVRLLNSRMFLFLRNDSIILAMLTWNCEALGPKPLAQPSKFTGVSHYRMLSTPECLNTVRFQQTPIGDPFL